MDVRPLRHRGRRVHHERGDCPRANRHAGERAAGIDRTRAIAMHSGAHRRSGSHARAYPSGTAGMAQYPGRILGTQGRAGLCG